MIEIPAYMMNRTTEEWSPVMRDSTKRAINAIKEAKTVEEANKIKSTYDKFFDDNPHFLF